MSRFNGIVMDLLEKMVDLLGEELLSVREYREILDLPDLRRRMSV